MLSTNMNTRIDRVGPERKTRKTGRYTFLAAYSLWRERRALSRLDAHLLRDIGKSPSEAAYEAARPFWDAPNRWFW